MSRAKDGFEFRLPSSLAKLERFNGRHGTPNSKLGTPNPEPGTQLRSPQVQRTVVAGDSVKNILHGESSEYDSHHSRCDVNPTLTQPRD